jgi:23S rRNA (adenine1618-N6)-methyltransferase
MKTPTKNKAPRARIEPAAIKENLHPRNRHRGRYDFPALIESLPELAAHARPNIYGDLSIDFADPLAVKALNCAILKHFYGISGWDIPPGYLCPPIPGRADYLHHLADLLAASNGGVVPRGPAVRGLDIGVGANAVYPIIGQAEYGWSFVGSEIDLAALFSAQAIADANPVLGAALELRHQVEPANVLTGLFRAGEAFDLVLCNPPFHASLAEAEAGSRRKWRNLGKAAPSEGEAPRLNFGGQPTELWCLGGEVGFVRRMVRESARFKPYCLWFSALVSREDNVPLIEAMLDEAGVSQMQVIDLAQGQKKSRIVAWSFLDPAQHADWAARRGVNLQEI